MTEATSGLENKAAQGVEGMFGEFMTAFEEFKRTNDARLAELETRGAADSVTEDKLGRLNQALDNAKAAIDRASLERARPRLEGGRPDAGDEYKEAFSAYVKRGEEKALRIGSNADGGYLVPSETDAEISRMMAALSPIRAIASVRQVSTTTYKKPVTTTGPVVGWASETGTRSETNSQVIDALSFPTAELYAMPAATTAFLDDAAVDVGQWIAEEVNAAFAQQEGIAFVSGDGTNKPKGFTTYTAVAEGSWEWGKLGYVASGKAGDWPDADESDVLVDLVYTLKAGYRQNASWVMNRKTQAAIRKLKDEGGNYLWQPAASADGKATLMGLPPSVAALEVGDSIALGNGLFEVTTIRDGVARQIEARALLPELALPVAGDRAPPGGMGPAPRAIPILAGMHLPPLPEDAMRSRLALGAFARPWPGVVSVTHAPTGAMLLDLPRVAMLGELADDLAGGSMFLWDEGNAVELTLFGGHLASRDEDEVLAGANRIAVETDSGAWEVIGFAEAELVATARYRLTRLLRGQQGTDHAIGPAASGARIVVLDGRIGTLPVSPAWLDTMLPLRGYAGAGDAVGVALEVAIGLAPLLPLAPVHLVAERVGGDVVLRWVRRSRADTDSWATEDAPLDWAPEAYRVTIHDGPDLLRTLDCASPEAVYAAAAQSADFGGPAGDFIFRVAQMSALYGAGHWAEGAFHG